MSRVPLFLTGTGGLQKVINWDAVTFLEEKTGEGGDFSYTAVHFVEGGTSSTAVKERAITIYQMIEEARR